MAEYLTLEDVATDVRNDALIGNEFQILQRVALGLSNQQEETEARDTLLRILEFREQLTDYTQLLNSLIRQSGLYPYMDLTDSSYEDSLATEVHRALPGDANADIFHREQLNLLDHILSDENVIVSAPTSFGKSRVIDAAIEIKQYDNVAIVVPTLALIDETRRRMAKFADTHRIVTQLSQSPASRNIFVFTPERVNAYEYWPSIDWFVIDEFYKLDLRRSDVDRAVALNQALQRLFGIGNHFYLLGPGIDSLTPDTARNIEAHYISTNFTTVASDQIRVPSTPSKEQALLELCEGLDEPTLIYCQSPRSANNVARLLLDAGLGESWDLGEECGEWLGRTYHPDWVFAEALPLGIGMHHGRLPRSLAQYVVRRFNRGDLKFLICTSSLIEGVNTVAKNVIIWDGNIGRTRLDYFTFNNIRGRSGRMFQYFVGRVFLFDDQPEPESLDLDIPILSQSGDMPDSLLVQIDENALTPENAAKLDGLRAQNVLSMENIRSNMGVDPQLQIALAISLMTAPINDLEKLQWRSNPSWDELLEACGLIWTHFVPGRFLHGVSSPRQLALLTSRLQRRDTLSQRIENQLIFRAGSRTVDEVVESVLAYDRGWAGYSLPRFLITLSNVQREILPKRGLTPGDFIPYASQVETLFRPPLIAALDEYGVPPEVGTRLISRFAVGAEDVDEVLSRLLASDVASYLVDPFERQIVFEALNDSD